VDTFISNILIVCLFDFPCVDELIFFLVFCAFLRAKTAMLSARLSHRNSVCPSVRPSVCLSHGWIRQKRSKLGSPNFLPSAAWKTLVSGTVKLFHKFEGGHPERGR